MGFLKRFFSFGSKKDKKRPPIPDVLIPAPKTPSADNERKRKLEEEEHEAAVGRLLRSSSSRYAVVKEVDYSNLPPLPHPINDVLSSCNNTPKEHAPSLRPSPSTASLASSNFSRLSTFSVTVHDRQRHAVTEFPNANGELGRDIQTPTQASKRLSHPLGLRSDPSVASLIELYDEQGRLPPEAFSNDSCSPEKQGRPQKKRGGSTLRELLGGSDSKGDSNIESDISWAEKYLGEDESNSSHSSFGPHTPSTCTDLTHDRVELPKPREFTFSTDMSMSIPDDPAMTSMEVELSDTGSTKDTNPYMNTDPTTPQRASQVFSFITRRNSTQHERVPSRIPFRSSSDVSHATPRSRFSTDGSLLDARASRHSRSSFGSTFQENNQTPMQRTPKPRAIPVSPVVEGDDILEPPQRKVRVLMSGPTKIMVTAPTPGFQQEQTSSRIPIRGPRQNPNKRKAPSSSHRTPMLTQRMNTTNGSTSSRGSARSRESSTGIPRRRPSRRNASRSSAASSATSSSRVDADILALATACALDQLARSRTYPHAGSPTRALRGSDKENQQVPGSLSARMDLPSTPLRSHTTGKSPLFRKIVTPSLFQPPTPGRLLESSVGNKSGGGGNSSSELSPLGKQMMLDARQQRMRVKEWDRERRSGRRSTPATPGRSGTRAVGSPF